jgi:hypothetical protein
MWMRIKLDTHQVFRLDSFLTGITQKEGGLCGHPISKHEISENVRVKAKPLHPEGAPPRGMPSQLRGRVGKTFAAQSSLTPQYNYK